MAVVWLQLRQLDRIAHPYFFPRSNMGEFLALMDV